MTLLEYALAYEKLGWSVMPVCPGLHPTYQENKVPYVKWVEFRERRATPEEIKKWWKTWPDANIGIITGKISGITVVDFDGPHARQSLEAIVGDIPETIAQSTGRPEGGTHALFKYDDNYPLKNRSKYIDNVDIRTNGGYIVVAPSVHESGTVYQWGHIDPVEDGLYDLCEMTKDMAEFLQSKADESNKTTDEKGTIRTRTPEEWNELFFEDVKKGGRNDRCYLLSSYGVGQWDEDKARERILKWGTEILTDPLSETEILTTFNSVLEAEKKKQKVKASCRKEADSLVKNGASEKQLIEELTKWNTDNKSILSKTDIEIIAHKETKVHRKKNEGSKEEDKKGNSENEEGLTEKEYYTQIWTTLDKTEDEGITFDIITNFNNRQDHPISKELLKKIFNSACKKFKAVGDITKKDLDEVMEKITVVSYPNGNKDFQIKATGFDETVKTEFKSITPKIFKEILYHLTEIVYPVPTNTGKGKEWDKFLNKITINADRVTETEDVTEIPTIRKLISSSISTGNPDNQETVINRQPIIYKEKIHLKLEPLMNMLDKTVLKGIEKTHVADILLRIGFCKPLKSSAPSRINGKTHRTWWIDFNKWIEPD